LTGFPLKVAVALHGLIYNSIAGFHFDGSSSADEKGFGKSGLSLG
jgi:hypothetical protein|tara:strand:- start:476 stop:610 length:135 start_codon:yes stop_codon:yes gene_type:complete